MQDAHVDLRANSQSRFPVLSDAGPKTAESLKRSWLRFGKKIMLAFMWWLIIGLAAGGLARLLMPGRQPMSWLATMVLGLIGSMVGGFISSVIFGYRADDPGFHASGLLMSTVGAVIALAIYLRFEQRRLT